MYISKLSENSKFLWQMPLPNPLSNCWYYRKAGENTINNFMAKISEVFYLSIHYTNHRLRSTTCTFLGDKYSDIDIQAISGHKSLSSLSIYKKVNDSKKIEISNDISRMLDINSDEKTKRNRMTYQN